MTSLILNYSIYMPSSISSKVSFNSHASCCFKKYRMHLWILKDKRHVMGFSLLLAPRTSQQWRTIASERGNFSRQNSEHALAVIEVYSNARRLNAFALIPLHAAIRHFLCLPISLLSFAKTCVGERENERRENERKKKKMLVQLSFSPLVLWMEPVYREYRYNA